MTACLHLPGPLDRSLKAPVTCITVEASPKSQPGACVYVCVCVCVQFVLGDFCLGYLSIYLLFTIVPGSTAVTFSLSPRGRPSRPRERGRQSNLVDPFTVSVF